jgi:hypothetical protein
MSVVADQATRAISEVLTRRAAQRRAEKLDLGWHWPSPLKRPDDAASALAGAHVTCEQAQRELAATVEPVRQAVVAAEGAAEEAARARSDLDSTKATRARQIAAASESGIVPEGMVTADAIEVRSAYVARLQERADRLRVEAIRAEGWRGETALKLARAEESVAIGKALVMAAELIAPIEAARLSYATPAPADVADLGEERRRRAESV